MNKGLTKEDSNKIKNILEEIETSPIAFDFILPVDYLALGLVDYPKIIKTPMDISTIKKKLNNSKYLSIQEVIDDIQLIWNNCRTYNLEGSEIYKFANKCEKLSNKLLEKNFKLGLSSKKDKKKIMSDQDSITEKKEPKRKNKKNNKNVDHNKSPSTNQITNSGQTNVNESDHDVPTNVIENKNSIGTEKNFFKDDKNKVGEKEIQILSHNKIKPPVESKKISLKKNDDSKNINETLNKRKISQVHEENLHEEEDEELDDSNPNRLSLKEKISLSDRVKLLANDGLASLVRLVQKECPSSIDDLDEENLQIKLNKLEKKTYEQINQLEYI